MEEKYGKRLYKLGTLPMVYMPVLCLEIALIVVFGSTLATNLSAGHVFSVPMVIAFILMVAVLVVVLRLLFVCRVEIYENALVVFTQFGSKVYTLDKITAILWSFPGENKINSRAARTNNTIAELIIKGEHKSVKLSDAYYKNLEKPLTAFQNEHNIPHTLEKQGSHRKYDSY